MPDRIRNGFISHIHEDDAGIAKLKSLLENQGMTLRDSSITSDKPNDAHNEDYIKYGILAPQIQWAGTLIVYVSPDTRKSRWVDWEIEYAHKQGKRIVGVWEWGAKGCGLPEALDKYGDAVVGWNGESIADAIVGKSNQWYRQDGSRWARRDVKRYSC